MEEKGIVLIETFTWARHGDHYDRWFSERKAEKPIDAVVSPTGLVAYWRDLPIAIGFLCKTDSRIAMITNLISEPHALSHIRSRCIDAVIEALSDTAAREGFLFVTTASVIPSIIKRLEKLGFTRTHENLINLGRSYVDSISNNGGQCASTKSTSSGAEKSSGPGQ